MDHSFDHDQLNKELSELREQEGLDVQLGYDGQCINVFSF